MKFTITIDNDGKGKQQSYEAKISIESDKSYSNGYWEPFDLIAWGADTDEASKNLRNLFNEFLSELISENQKSIQK